MLIMCTKLFSTLFKHPKMILDLCFILGNTALDYVRIKCFPLIDVKSLDNCDETIKLLME